MFTINALRAQTLVSTDVQTPFLGTPISSTESGGRQDIADFVFQRWNMTRTHKQNNRQKNAEADKMKEVVYK